MNVGQRTEESYRVVALSSAAVCVLQRYRRLGRFIAIEKPVDQRSLALNANALYIH
jgi:hypothetical protein